MSLSLVDTEFSSMKTELVMPHVDFHKLPHKISAEGRRVPGPADKMAAVTKLLDGAKPNPFFFNPTILAQMYALNNMLPNMAAAGYAANSGEYVRRVTKRRVT